MYHNKNINHVHVGNIFVPYFRKQHWYDSVLRGEHPAKKGCSQHLGIPWIQHANGFVANLSGFIYTARDTLTKWGLGWHPLVGVQIAMVVLALSKLGMREIRKKSLEPDFFSVVWCFGQLASSRAHNFRSIFVNFASIPWPLDFTISPHLFSLRFNPLSLQGYVGNGHVNGDVSAPRCVRFRVAGWSWWHPPRETTMQILTLETCEVRKFALHITVVLVQSTIFLGFGVQFLLVLCPSLLVMKSPVRLGCGNCPATLGAGAGQLISASRWKMLLPAGRTGAV